MYFVHITYQTLFLKAAMRYIKINLSSTLALCDVFIKYFMINRSRIPQYLKF